MGLARWAGPRLRASVSSAGGGQTSNLVLYLQLALLEAADGIIIGMRAQALLIDGLLKGSMLVLERFDVVHCAHGRPPRLLRTGNCDSYIARSHAESSGLSGLCITQQRWSPWLNHRPSVFQGPPG